MCRGDLDAAGGDPANGIRRLTTGDRPPVLRDGYAADEITELDLERAGVSSLIWSAGYSFDFDLIKLPGAASNAVASFSA